MCKLTLEVGQRFDTCVETGCIVLTLPDEFGEFEAEDSDGVVCSFSVDMVHGVVGHRCV